MPVEETRPVGGLFSGEPGAGYTASTIAPCANHDLGSRLLGNGYHTMCRYSLRPHPRWTLNDTLHGIRCTYSNVCHHMVGPRASMTVVTGCIYCDIGLAVNHAREHWATWNDGMRYARLCTRVDDATALHGSARAVKSIEQRNV